MKFLSTVFKQNKPLAWVGLAFLGLSIFLAIAMPFHTGKVLGINALVKPLKFSISIWIFCWTMAFLLQYWVDQVLIRRLSLFIVFTMLYEQGVITIQAFRGTLSHFNVDTPLESTLFSLMGIFITLMTVAIVFANVKFWRQRDTLAPVIKSSIFWGINIFAFAALAGGIMGSLLSHNVGGEMGGEGLAFVNWSTKIGDLRVGHFIGIHALQIIPFLGFWLDRREVTSRSIIHCFSLFLFLFVSFTLGQALLGYPLWQG